MKRKIVTVIIIATVLLSGCGNKSVGTEYPTVGKVVDINRDERVVAVETYSGHIYGFYSNDDWELGDCVPLTMNDNGTRKVTDDKIVNYSHSGWEINK